MARARSTIRAAGGRPGDIFRNAISYGMFTGGHGYHDGAERLGCMVIPTSGGQAERQVKHILKVKPSLAGAARAVPGRKSATACQPLSSWLAGTGYPESSGTEVRHAVVKAHPDERDGC